jgi:hypothetical protein
VILITDYLQPQMNTESDQARAIAERIARRVASGNASASHAANGKAEATAEIARVRANISELQQRLAQLESRQPHDLQTSNESAGNASPFSNQSLAPAPSTPFTHSPWLAGVNATAAHAAEERFGVEEATINELVDFFQSEKMCSLDPSGKPCDHCAMCSSRGF